MSSLWSAQRRALVRAVEPLAVRMRPRSIEEVVGQRHILGPGKLLRRLLDADALTSLIFHGPPGTGKTTLAEVIAAHTGRHFERENAAAVGVQRIREISADAQRRLEDGGRRTVLFLDEIHRFSRAQQDVLLGDVERGLVTLIGATTENPLFAVNSALVSRSTLLRLEPLDREAIGTLVRRAIADPQRGFGSRDIRIDDAAIDAWAELSDGDARRALGALEVAVLSAGDRSPIVIDRAVAQDCIQRKAAAYDHTGDEHYDAASALIKSVRGSDPDAAVYWLARMLDAGEDPRFIARRLAILASEDIGNADPRGIMVAAAAWELVERIGMPEARITLAQCTTYLALAPKSNASYAAVDAALADVRSGRTIPVPAPIKDGNVRKATERSAGSNGPGPSDAYAYAHTQGVKSDLLGMVGTQDYLGAPRAYYAPADSGFERTLRERLDESRRLRGGP